MNNLQVLKNNVTYIGNYMKPFVSPELEAFICHWVHDCSEKCRFAELRWGKLSTSLPPAPHFLLRLKDINFQANSAESPECGILCWRQHILTKSNLIFLELSLILINFYGTGCYKWKCKIFPSTVNVSKIYMKPTQNALANSPNQCIIILLCYTVYAFQSPSIWWSHVCK